MKRVFAENYGPGQESFEWNGRTVEMALELSLEKSAVIQARVLKCKRWFLPQQGLGVSMREGKYTDRGRHLAGGYYMYDHEPWAVLICVPVKDKPREILLYNVWDSPGGNVDYWIGDSEIIIDKVSEAPETYILNCACGLGKQKFDELIVEVKVLPPGDGLPNC